eukprot:scaffold65513_cov64-Phaeocystis_antarctica.AAC.6
MPSAARGSARRGTRPCTGRSGTGCVLLRARAPPVLEAGVVDELGGAAARARLHERAVVALQAQPAPL